MKSKGTVPATSSSNITETKITTKQDLGDKSKINRNEVLDFDKLLSEVRKIHHVHTPCETSDQDEAESRLIIDNDDDTAYHSNEDDIAGNTNKEVVTNDTTGLAPNIETVKVTNFEYINLKSTTPSLSTLGRKDNANLENIPVQGMKSNSCDDNQNIGMDYNSTLSTLPQCNTNHIDEPTDNIASKISALLSNNESSPRSINEPIKDSSILKQDGINVYNKPNLKTTFNDLKDQSKFEFKECYVDMCKKPAPGILEEKTYVSEQCHDKCSTVNEMFNSKIDKMKDE